MYCGQNAVSSNDKTRGTYRNQFSLKDYKFLKFLKFLGF
jgi:hypothetical protein